MFVTIADGQDDMTVSMSFREEDDNLYEAIPARHGGRSRASSGASDASILPPPLPNTLPPPANFRRTESPSNDSYYLPSSHHGDDAASADEASELEDDGVLLTFHRPTRAKSADRDSDFSEGGALSSYGSLSPRVKRRGTRLGKNTGSLDSIPDSGMGTLHQSEKEMFREKISELEKLLKVIISLTK